MTQVTIISGFLGAGKTTLIKKLIQESFKDEKVVLIENEFGEIGIDGSFLKDAGIEITEMNSGCICCSLVGDFTEALGKVVEEFHPDRIIIEPSGVGKLSDVIQAVKDVNNDELQLVGFVDVIDVKKCRVYSTNFGEFFNNQIEYASTIILSRTQDVSEKTIEDALHIIKEKNQVANVITTPWEELTAKTILEAIENKDSLKEILMKEADICPVCGHHHEHEHEHHHEHDHDHHDHHEHEHEHHHHHDHHGHEHEHHHDHDHHHADEIFTSIGIETIKTYDPSQLEELLKDLSNNSKYGEILRAKGILSTPDHKWLHFDMVPGEYEVRFGPADYTGRICVIGKDIEEHLIKELFGVE